MRKRRKKYALMLTASKRLTAAKAKAQNSPVPAFGVQVKPASPTCGRRRRDRSPARRAAGGCRDRRSTNSCRSRRRRRAVQIPVLQASPSRSSHGGGRAKEHLARGHRHTPALRGADDQAAPRSSRPPRRLAPEHPRSPPEDRRGPPPPPPPRRHPSLLAGTPPRPLHCRHPRLRSLLRRRTRQARHPWQSPTAPTRSSTHPSTPTSAPPSSSTSRPHIETRLNPCSPTGPNTATDPRHRPLRP